MATWRIELVTNGITCNIIELEAESVAKISHYAILVDGLKWELPCICEMSFAMVEKESGTEF